METTLIFWPIGAGSLKLGRLAGLLYEVSITFLPYKNGSKLLYHDLLRPIPTHTEGPSDFKKFV